jgi:hypothetical protein
MTITSYDHDDPLGIYAACDEHCKSCAIRNDGMSKITCFAMGTASNGTQNVYVYLAESVGHDNQNITAPVVIWKSNPDRVEQALVKSFYYDSIYPITTTVTNQRLI